MDSLSGGEQGLLVQPGLKSRTSIPHMKLRATAVKQAPIAGVWMKARLKNRSPGYNAQIARILLHLPISHTPCDLRNTGISRKWKAGPLSVNLPTLRNKVFLNKQNIAWRIYIIV
jgi:hypothetical protein